VYGKLGRTPQRVADLKAAVGHGAAGAVMLDLAAEHEQGGEWAEAAALYLRASEKGPVPWHQAGLVCLGRLGRSRPRERYHLLNTAGAGRCEDAIRTLEKGLALVNGRGAVQDHVFLALAHQRLGHADEARKWKRLTAAWTAPTDRRFFWERLEVEVLRRELDHVK
jgi:hypothetical protein